MGFMIFALTIALFYTFTELKKLQVELESLKREVRSIRNTTDNIFDELLELEEE